MTSEYPEPPASPAVSEKLDDLPASPLSEAAEEASSPPDERSRLFCRQRSLHEILGGGKPADAFLWKNKFMSAGILVAATGVYLLFEHSGCTVINILSNLLIVTIIGLYLWSKLSGFLNRSLPPIPTFCISEEQATSLALAVRAELNKILTIVHETALGKDFKRSFEVIAILWGVGKVGGWFHFLTLTYLAVVLAHSVPIMFEKYEDQIEAYAQIAVDQAHKQYRKVDAAVLSKVMKKD